MFSQANSQYSMFLSKRTFNICNKLACNFQFPRVPSIFGVFYKDPQYWICLTKLTLNIWCVKQSIPSIIDVFDQAYIPSVFAKLTVQTIRKNKNPLTHIFMGPTHKIGFYQKNPYLILYFKSVYVALRFAHHAHKYFMCTPPCRKIISLCLYWAYAYQDVCW